MKKIVAILLSLYFFSQAFVPVNAQGGCVNIPDANHIYQCTEIRTGAIFFCADQAACVALNEGQIEPPIGFNNNPLPQLSDNFAGLNQYLIGNPALQTSDNFVGNLINALMPFLLVIAGLTLFGMLVSGGYQIMTAIQNPDQAEAGKKKISAAVVGFILLFTSYWLVQLLEIIFGISILSA